jgi:hypothetical protein
LLADLLAEEGRMDPAAERPRLRNPAHLILLCLLWMVAVLAAYLFRGNNAFEQDVRAVGRRLQEALWVLPLAVAVLVTVLSMPLARRWWPKFS